MRFLRLVLMAALLVGAGCTVRVQRAPGAGGGAPAAVGELTVVLVRHGEKVDESADALLSETGQRRARALAEALQHAGVRGIVVTQYRRTRDTAAPLATRLGLDPRAVPTIAGNVPAHAEQVAAAVRESAAGTVLVVGHSNTVPAIIRALGGPDVGAIGDDDYHDFFVLHIAADGVRLIRSTY